jgi:RNA polymerase sigma factor (TIGR02999 family)
MTDVTNILGEIEDGDPSAVEKLLPLVYEELRKLAAAKMAVERGDHSLQPTGLVHEAYLRLVDVEKVQKWNSRGHFFGAAAEAMRRILVDSARRKASQKRGANLNREKFDGIEPTVSGITDDVLVVDEALEELVSVDVSAAELVKLRYFGGLTVQEAADAMGISARTADRIWTFARSWLFRRLQEA